MTMSNKKFIGVTFYTGQWQVIPQEWLFPDHKFTYWPAKGNVEKQVRERIEPNPKTWSVWPIHEIRETSGELNSPLLI